MRSHAPNIPQRRGLSRKPTTNSCTRLWLKPWPEARSGLPSETTAYLARNRLICNSILDANLLRPPARLRAIDLLPGPLPAAWTGKPEKTTVGRIFAELKAQKGRPWPTLQFIDVLNDAVNRGILVRTSGGRELASVTADADRELRVPTAGATIPPPKPPAATGANESTEATLDLTQLQDFAEGGAAALTKVLAGAAPEFAVKIRLNGKPPSNIAAANDVLGKISPDWKFGS